MKKSFAVISLVLAMVVMEMVVTGCSSSKSNVNKEEAMTQPTNVMINENDQDDQEETTSVTKEQCMEVAKYGMDIAIAQMQGDEKKLQELSEKVMKLEKKYELEGTKFEKKCEPYMMDPEFLQMVQQQGMMLQNVKK